MDDERDTGQNNADPERTDTRAIDTKQDRAEVLTPQQVEALRTIKRNRKQALFLRSFSRSGIVGAACNKAKISRSTLHGWRENDRRFAQLYQEAIDQSNDRLEREARRRAERGWLEPVYQRGAQVGNIRKYSDQLMITLLKGRRPEVYKDRAEVEQKIRHGALIDSSASTDDELRARIAAALAMLPAGQESSQAPPSTQNPDVLPALPARDDDEQGER